MDELNMSWEDKLKKTQSIQKERYVCCACVSKTLLVSIVLPFSVNRIFSDTIPNVFLDTKLWGC